MVTTESEFHPAVPLLFYSPPAFPFYIGRDYCFLAAEGRLRIDDAVAYRSLFQIDLIINHIQVFCAVAVGKIQEEVIVGKRGVRVIIVPGHLRFYIFYNNFPSCLNRAAGDDHFIVVGIVNNHGDIFRPAVCKTDTGIAFLNLHS